MINRIKLLNLFKRSNQVLVARYWSRYRNRLILSGLLSSRIEKMYESYKKGLITAKEFHTIILDDINKHYKTMMN